MVQVHVMDANQDRLVQFPVKVPVLNVVSVFINHKKLRLVVSHALQEQFLPPLDLLLVSLAHPVKHQLLEHPYVLVVKQEPMRLLMVVLHVHCVLLVNSHRQALRLVQIVPLDLFQRLALQPVLHAHLGSIQVKVHQRVSVVHLEHLHQ